MLTRITGIMLLILVIAGSMTAAAAIDGEEILSKMDETMKTESKFMEEDMILYTASGSERKRSVDVWNKTKDGEDKMLVKFTEPANVAGTAFLMVEDDMWLYLPALGKVKRIAGSAKQGSFMGSDLTYEDMQALGNTGFAVDYQSELIDEVELGDNQAYHLQLEPRGDELAYNKLEMWVDKDIWLPLKIEYYNKSDELEKVLKTEAHKQIDGRWTATRMEVENKLKGSKTVLVIKEVDFAREIDDKIFTTRSLERGQ